MMSWNILFFFSQSRLLMKMNPGVNFINFIRACFSYERQTLNIHVTRKKLPKQRSHKKFVRKMLKKLTPGVNFTNVSSSFYMWRSQKQKQTLITWLSFLLLGSLRVKAADKHLDEIHTWLHQKISKQIFYLGNWCKQESFTMVKMQVILL